MSISWIANFYIRPITSCIELSLLHSKKYYVLGIEEVETEEALEYMFVVKNENGDLVKIATPLAKVELFDPNAFKTLLK